MAAGLREQINDWRGIERQVNDAVELAGLDDDSLRAELEAEVAGLESELEKRSFTAMLSGPYDAEDALLAIHAGAGGTDSQDWASMLMRMYLRWAEKHGYETDVWDMTEGEEAGIKSVTIAINGKYAFGYLRSEKGVHRLVRLSPFDSAHRRHTSFALVEILPLIAYCRFRIHCDGLSPFDKGEVRTSGSGSPIQPWYILLAILLSPHLFQSSLSPTNVLAEYAWRIRGSEFENVRFGK